MRYHLEAYWPIYIFVAGLAGMTTMLVISIERDHYMADYCFRRNAVVADTAAGPRCAPISTLERIP